jgi:Tfp pilus assembly protein PilF
VSAHNKAGNRTAKGRQTDSEAGRSWLFVIAILALTYRVVCFAAIGSHPLLRLPVVDAGYHDAWAQRMVAGDWLGHSPDDVFKPPLYPAFLAGLYGLFGGRTWMVQCIQLLIGVLSCLLLATLGARLLGRRVGYITGLIGALYAPFVFFELQLLTPVLSLSLNLAALVLLMAPTAKPRFSGHLLLVGLLLGLSMAVRPDVVLPALLVGGYLLLQARHRSWRDCLMRALCVGVGVTAVVLPVTVRNYVLVRQVIPISSNAGVNFYVGNRAGANGVSAVPVGLRWERMICGVPQEVLEKPAAASRWWVRATQREIEADPIQAIKRLGRKAAAFCNRREFRNNICFHFMQQLCWSFRWSPSQLGLVLPLAVCGWIGLIRSRQPALARAGLVSLLWVVGYWLGGMLFFVTARFRLPAVPLLIIPAAWCLSRIAQMTRARQWRGLAVCAAVIGAAGVVCWPSWLGAAPADWARDYVNLSRSLAQAGDQIGSMRACRRALEITPDDPDAQVQLARMLLPHDRVRALQHFEAARAQIPDAPSLLLAIGQVHLQAGQRAQARKTFSDLLDLAGKVNCWPMRAEWAGAHIFLAELEPEQAHTHWEQAWSIDPRTTAEAAFLRSREPTRVLEAFAAEAAQKPWDWYSQANLGMALLESNRPPEAAESLRRATQLAPHRQGLSFQLAIALHRSGQTQQAQVILDRLARTLPAGGLLNQVQHLRGQIHRQQ